MTEGTTSGGSSFSTVTENAFVQGLINAEVVGISFEPTDSASDTNGLLTFGGVDSTRYTGDIAYVYV